MTTENTKSGEMKKTVPSYAEIAAIMDEEIQDKTLKLFLFGSPKIKESFIKGIGIFYKILMYAFIFALAKYKHDVSNAKRAMEALDCVYDGEDVNLDFIIYVLTEMQLDVITNDKKSYFSCIFSNEENITQIPIFRQLIKTWLSSAAYAEKDEEVLRRLLFGLYRSLSVFQKVELREKEVETGKTEEEEIVTYEFYFGRTKEVIGDSCLFKQVGGEFYYLASYEYFSNAQLKLVYASVVEKKLLIKMVSKSDFFGKMEFGKHLQTPKTIFAKSLDTLDFKYIKNLALAVSDVITQEMKRKLSAHYSILKSDTFNLGYRESDEMDWDNILTILMFEEGPSNILEFVLDSDGFCFERILRNLEIRYNDPTISEKAKRFYSNEQKKEMNALKNYMGSTFSLVKNMNEINKILMAKAIINGLAEVDRQEKQSNACFVESLPMRIKNLTNIINSSDSVSGKVIAINHALEKTFRHIIPFYYGIIAYNETKTKEFAILHSKGKSWRDVEIERRNIYFKCEEAFKERASEVARSLAVDSLGVLKKKFLDFARTLMERKGHIFEITSDGKNLQEAIGRNYLCSIKTLEKIWKISPQDVLDEYRDSVKDIANYINTTKHSKTGTGRTNIIFFDDFCMKVKELLYFFIYNEDYQREMLLGQQVSYDPIYPYVVRYEAKSENRDCCNINSFSVFLTEDNDKKEIKILSDREYVINEKYYCIPNVTSSNRRWWIEPFLINCREYDQLIADAMENAGKSPSKESSSSENID